MTTEERAIAYIRELFAENAGGHDAAHTLRVYRNAMRIADREPACDREIVALAALLHDVDDHKLFATEDNANARAFLEENHVPADRQEQILAAVNAVSFTQNRDRRPETREGQIVRDADRLDAMGAIGIARTFAYGGEHGRPIEESIAHFHEKLLLLKDTLDTEAAKRMVEDRHAFLLAFLEEYERESGEAHDAI